MQAFKITSDLRLNTNFNVTSSDLVNRSLTQPNPYHISIVKLRFGRIVVV